MGLLNCATKLIRKVSNHGRHRVRVQKKVRAKTTKSLTDRFDHSVLTVKDIEETMNPWMLSLEKKILRRRPRYALRFGNHVCRELGWLI